jgi:hypothetical protein
MQSKVQTLCTPKYNNPSTIDPSTKIKEHDSSKPDKKPQFEPDSPAYLLAELLRAEHAKADPEYIHSKSWPSTLQNWAADIDLLLRKDKRPDTQVIDVIRWCQADPFWQSNILSGKKLRDKYPQLYLRMIGSKKATGCTQQLSEDDREYLREIQRRQE